MSATTEPRRYQQLAFPFEGKPSYYGTCSHCWTTTIVDAPDPEGFCDCCHEDGVVESIIRHRIYHGEWSTDKDDPNTPANVKRLIADGVINVDPVKIIHAPEPLEFDGKSIFLAGPTPRSDDVESWRPEATKLFWKAGYKGTLLSPEGRTETWDYGGYKNQVEWEYQALHRADVILFWVPREMRTLPGLTTNDEFGYWSTTTSLNQDGLERFIS